MSNVRTSALNQALSSLKIGLAKFRFPQVGPETIERPRLLELLSKAASTPITVLEGGAGTGKTCLLGHWIHDSNERHHIWISLESRDNDFSRFFSVFFSAIRHGQASESGRGNIEAASHTKLPPPVVEILAEEELNKFDSDVWIILDDLHEICDQDILKTLESILSNAPPQVHFILSGRSMPSFTKGPLRLRKRISHIQGKDLAFQANEIRSLWKQEKGSELDDTSVEAISNQTEGWVAALRISLLSQEDDSPSIFDLNACHSDIFAYLGEAIFEPLPEETRDFLLSISVVDRLTPLLCAKLSNQSDAAIRLENVRSAGLFVERKKGTDGQYFYALHSLFREFLRDRLALHMESRKQGLHIKASEWFLESGEFQEAIHHAVQSGDETFTADLLEKTVPRLTAAGKATDVIAGIERLPDSQIFSHHNLCIHYIWNLMVSRQHERAKYYLDGSKPLRLIETSTPSVVSDPAELRKKLDWTLLDMLCEISTRDCLASIEAPMETIREYKDALPPDIQCRIVLFDSYLKLQRGELPSARSGAQSYASCEIKELRHAAALCKMIVGTCDQYRGNLKSAEEIYEDVLKGALRDFGESGVASAAAASLARLFYEKNDLVKAKDYATKALPRLQVGAPVECWIGAYQTMIRLEALDNNLDHANSLVDSFLGIGQKGSFKRIIAAAVNERVWLMTYFDEPGCKDSTEFKQLIDDAHAIELRRDLKDYNEFFFRSLALSRALRHSGQYRQAIETLRRVVETALPLGRVDIEVEARSLHGICSMESGNIEQATSDLERVLSVASIGGFVRSILDHGSVALQWLQLSEEKTIRLRIPERAKAHLDLLLGGREQRSPTLAKTLADLKLTSKEQSILSLLALGLNNREIGERTNSQASTVKWHLKNLYAKLQIQRRAQAVAIATELGLGKEAN